VFLVCNPELPSLHLTRKCLAFLEQLGFGRERFSLLINRMSRKQELAAQDIEKEFSYPVSHVFPEDHTAAHRALTSGKPIAPNCELGRLLRDFSNSAVGSGRDEKKKGMAGLKLTALLSHG
jgi:pilus assembly protein CpaE